MQAMFADGGIEGTYSEKAILSYKLVNIVQYTGVEQPKFDFQVHY